MKMIKELFKEIAKSILKVEIDQYDDQIKRLLEENKKLGDEIFDLTYESPKEEYYNNKYPKAQISYKGRSLPFSKEKISVPVTDLITPNNWRIKQDLKKWGLLNSSLSFEKLIPKIYKKIKKEYYKYDFDKNTWGNVEVWEFPFESFEIIDNDKGLDCDSWAIFQASYYIAAGFPSWRVRCVAGNTYRGEGHLTVYLFSEEDNKWHHLNSTYGINMDHTSLKDYPYEEHLNRLGIKNVWFSFNNLFSWHKFETTESEKQFKEKAEKEILIK